MTQHTRHMDDDGAIIDGAGIQIAAVMLSGRQVNGPMIAATPDLLAALSVALRDSGCDGDLCAHQWHEMAREAIAKAEGSR